MLFYNQVQHDYTVYKHHQVKDEANYRIAGNFRGVHFSRFSRLICKPRKLYPRNKCLHASSRHPSTRDCKGLGYRDCSIDQLVSYSYFSSISNFLVDVITRTIASIVCDSRAISQVFGRTQ